MNDKSSYSHMLCCENTHLGLCFYSASGMGRQCRIWVRSVLYVLCKCLQMMADANNKSIRTTAVSMWRGGGLHGLFKGT